MELWDGNEYSSPPPPCPPTLKMCYIYERKEMEHGEGIFQIHSFLAIKESYD